MSKTPPILINFAVILLTALFISPHASAAGETIRPFDIPRGDAADTLKLFAQQSSEQVVYPPRDVRGVRTNAVKGRFTPVDALRQMLRGTALSVLHDERTGALAIKRNHDPNAARTAPNGLPGDRPQSNEATSRIQSATNDSIMITNKRPALHRVLGALASLLISASPLPAQSGSGAIAGRVFNPVTSEYVRNAEVRINGTELVTSTEQDGAFRFDRVPAGDVTLSVTYTGYQPVTETLRVSEGGIATREINLTSLVGGGSSDATIKLQEFVVSGDREGNAKAIMQQRNSMNITQSVASDVFGDILDGNVGEFIKYLPGVDVEAVETRAYLPRLGGLEPNFTGVAIDGVRTASADAQLSYNSIENSQTGDYVRATGFDQVSLNSIESIEIATTLSPDMDADAPAGRINLKTKRAFDTKGRRITYQAGVTMNSSEFHFKKAWGPQHSKERLARPNYMFGYSESFLNNRFGIMLNLSQARTYDEYHRVTPTYNRTTVGSDQRPAVLTQIVLKDGPNLAGRFAGTLTADFKVTPQLNVGMNFVYNSYEHSQDGSNTLVFNLAANGTAAATGRQNVLGDGLTDVRTNGLPTNTSRNVSVGSAPVFKNTRNVSYTPRFEYRRGPLKISGTYGYSHGNSAYSNKEQGHLAVNIGALAGIDFRAARPSPTSPVWTITQTGGPDWSNLANYRGNTSVTAQGRTSKVDVEDAQIDGQYTLPFRLPSFIKLGGKWNEESRKSTDIRAYETWSYIGPGGNPGGSWAGFESGNPISMDVGSEDWLYIANMPPRRDAQAVGELFHTRPDYFVRSGTAENYYSAFVANDRDFRQKLLAGYGMGNLRLGRVQFQGGMRWERTTTQSREWNPLSAQQVQAAGFPVNANTRRATTIPGIEYQYFSRPRVTREGEYDKWFPSISAKVNFTRNLNAHFGYNRAISRPPVNALSGVWVVDDLNGRVNAPNPELMPADSDKLVARLAYYFEPVGSFTLQVSQNTITNLRQTHTYTADEFGYGNDPEWATYEFLSTTNDPFKRRLRSLELGYNQALSFLPGPLRGLNVNLAYTRNYANVRRPGVVPNRASSNLGWNWGRYSLRYGAVWTDATPWNLNPVGAPWMEPMIKHDLGGSFRISKHAILFFQGRNITNETRLVYASLINEQGEQPYLLDARNFGANWLFGIKGSF